MSCEQFQKCGREWSESTAYKMSTESIWTSIKFGRSVACNVVQAEVVYLLGNAIKKAARRGYTLHDIKNSLADAGGSVPLARLEALFDKVPDLEPIKAGDGSREVISPSAPPPNGVGETGKHGSTGRT